MIDTTQEQPLPLALLSREVTNRDGDRGINVSTMFRWIQRGVKGVRLETVMIGGIRMSSREALARFFQATTRAANGEAPAVSTPKQRERAIAEAAAELQASGI